MPANSGLLRTAGYSWDSQIAPQLKLSSSDCIDGKCPVDRPEDRWTPGDKLRDIFGGGAKDRSGWAKDALWGWLDIVVSGIVCLVVVGVVAFLAMLALVVFVYVIRKNRS